MFNLLINKNNIGNKKYYSLILFFFQFIGLLIYIEIIELNFCNLNKNTIHKIQLREEIDRKMTEDENEEGVGSESLVEIGDYIIDDRKTKASEIPFKIEN
jgi:hypothetical protein